MDRQSRYRGALLANPLRAIEGPTGTVPVGDDDDGPRALTGWTLPQVRALLAALDGTWLARPVGLVLMTGLRRGELLGLRWGDLDLDHHLLLVRQQAITVGGQTRLTPPKSRAARRSVHLPPAAVALLAAQARDQARERALLGDLWRDHDLVFPGDRGDILPRSTFGSRWQQAQRRLVAAGLPPLRFHDLRHLHASLGVQAGVHQRVMMARLGHTNQALTLDIYSHVAAPSDDDAALRIGALLDDLTH